MKNRADLIFSLVILVAGLLVFLKSQAFPDLPEGHPGPGLFPAYIGGGLFICGLFLFINSFRIKIANRVDFSGSWTPVILILLLMIVFPFAYNLLGFFPVIAVAILLV
ncbi:MAG: tripartite tricarboxylate transporter TctB family protein, partial [Saprospiraceae bacterium]|nr:tripartite tricarboxylate transporter TctB family protein [Saprospiraceae bacterium]